MKNVEKVNIKRFPITKKFEFELQNFQKKLTNLSKRNRNIWTSKSTNYNFSIYNIEQEQLEKINYFLNNDIKDLKLNLKLTNLENATFSIKNFNFYYLKNNKKIYLKKQNKNSNFKKSIDEKNFLQFNNLEKENQKIKNEIGYATFYFVPYYFLKNFNNGNKIIPVRSPIFLIPIFLKFDHSNHKVIMNFDNTRDILTNNFIIENFLKIDDYYYNLEKSFLENIKLLFKNFKKDKKLIDKYFLNYHDEVIEFKNYEKIIKFNFNFSIEKTYTIGFFDKYDNAIKRDLNLILESGYSTEQLKKYSTTTNIKKDNNKNLDFFDNNQYSQKNNYNRDEKKIFYVDNLNDQQFLALKKINDKDIDNLVIWGPPGTGKSQTILSIIYDAILKNKKVAIVSEKRAALDVIYKRLKKLNRFAFYLTDINNKSEFYEQINHSYETSKEILEQEEVNFIDNKSLLDEINKLDILSQKIINILEEMDLIDFHKNIPSIENKKILEIMEEHYGKFKNFDNFLKLKIDNEKINSFILKEGSKKNNFSIFLDEIKFLLKNHSALKINKIIELREKITRKYGSSFVIKNNAEVSDYFNSLIDIKKEELILEEKNLKLIWNDLWKNINDSRYDEILKYFENDKLNSFVASHSLDLFEKLFTYSHDLIYFSKIHPILKKYFFSLLKNDFQEKLFSKYLVENDNFKLEYKNLRSDFDLAKKEFLNNKIKYDRKYGNQKKELQVEQSIAKMIIILKKSFNEIKDYDLLKNKIILKYNNLFKKNQEEQKNLITKYKNLEANLNLSFKEFQIIKNFTDDQFYFLKEFLSFIKKNKIKYDKLLEIIEFKIFRERINKFDFLFKIEEQVFKWKDNYKDFLNLRKDKIDKFSKIAKYYLAMNFWINFRKTSDQFKRIIFNVKKKWGVKVFLQNEAKDFKNLYKIWLLNPETISSIFTLEDQFDLVIFDEASQMFIERSLPSIERSKKVVILGDEKQLSPTNFFISRNTTEELEKYEEDNLIDNKLSLLTYAKAKFPHIMLEHHYRSDYKELIEYSNKIFYNSNLTFITKNNKNIDYQPIEYYQINDALYKNSLNKKESDKIIEILISIKNLEKFKDKSIGIITMNSRQEKYILEQIASIGFSDLEFANWINSRDVNLFVKNIENVQGDERDIIIFSTLYGKNEEGKVLFNFGPINQEGGINRINVAITRSRLKMYVVTSLKQIDFENFFIRNNLHKHNLESGIYILYRFLKYCMELNNNLSLNERFKLKEFKSNFEKDFYFELKKITNKYNLNVANQDDNYGYNIDFLIYDQDNKVSLLIETDEIIKNSYKSVRKRDISKQDFLNERGYKFYRVWINNWFNNQKQELKNIENLIKNN